MSKRAAPAAERTKNKKHAHALARWAFTMPYERCERGELVKQLKLRCKAWVFQEERGASGYRHWQGRVSLKKKIRVTEWPWLSSRGGNLSIESNAGFASGLSEFYCMDPDKTVDGPWTDKTERSVYIQHALRNPQLRPWQSRLMEKLQTMYDARNNRHMLLVSEPVGNRGKSWMMKYLFSHKGAILVPSLCSSAHDIVQFVASITQDGWRGIIVLDLPRSMNVKHWHLLAQAAETLKNGVIYDTRYAGKVRVIEPPQIVVFTNGGIPPGVFSGDRVIRFDIGGT